MSSKEDLREKLEMVLDFMVEKGLISEKARDEMKKESQPGQEDSPLHQMANELDEKGVEARDVYDIQFQNKLMGMFSAKALGMEKIAGLFFENLRDGLGKEEEPSLEKLAEKTTAMSNTLTVNHKNNVALTPSLHPDFAMLAKKMVNDYKKMMRPAIEKRFPQEKDKKLAELDSLLTPEIEDGIAKMLRNSFGGDDPRIAGEVQYPVLGPIFGNLIGMTNQTTPNENSVAYMVQSNTYNPNMPDDLGLESSKKGSLLGELMHFMLEDPRTPPSIKQNHKMTHLEP